MKQFKKIITIKSIAEALMKGLPLSKHWEFPDFLLNNKDMLYNFFGKEAYDIYNKLTISEQKKAISWYETHGVKTTKMYGGELSEDWDNSTIPKRNIKLLHDNHLNVYNAVASSIVTTLFTKRDPDFQIQMIDKMRNNYNLLEDTLKRIVG